MKKIWAILIALAMLCSLAACAGGGGEVPQNGEEPQSGQETPTPPENQEQEEELPAASTKTLAYFQKFLSAGEYTMEMKTSAEGMEMTVKSAYKDDMLYSESDFGGQKSIMVMKEGYQYLIDHSAKTVMKMQVVDNSAVTEMFADEAASYEVAIATGTTEYNGKTYEYEEFTLDGEKVQYLFEGDQIKIMKATVMDTESVVELVSLQKGADAKLFEIPEDYQMITY